ncbi:MAG: hypothetical protein VB100_10940 [Angelakisella sp.]|nr:hypothetical protein [Angelakisella sp.]
MSTNKLAGQVRELKELQRLIEEATAEAEAIKDMLKREMTQRNVNEMLVDCFKLKYTVVNSQRFDSTAFKKIHADLFEQYSKTTTSARLTVA